MSEAQSDQYIQVRKGMKPRKYVPTEAIDRKIREIYAQRIDKKLHHLPNLKEYANQIGWPHWAVKKRGRELGVARTKEEPWTDAEIQILERWSYQSDARIQIKLRRAGFHRTETAIHLKIKRLAIKAASNYYTANRLAGFMGVESHAVLRWMKLGYLKAERRGTERTEKQGGDMYLIKESDIRQFFVSHPMAFDLRKITDQIWFLDLITEGKLCH